MDLLKIDIEGSEWDVLEQLLAHYGTNLPFTQLQVRGSLSPNYCRLYIHAHM